MVSRFNQGKLNLGRPRLHFKYHPLTLYELLRLYKASKDAFREMLVDSEAFLV